MSFESFEESWHLVPAGQSAGEPWRDEMLVGVDGYLELTQKYAGCSFENGLYRLHDARTGPQAMKWLSVAYSHWLPHVRPFGYDWFGREFCVDFSEVENGEPQILLIDMESDEGYFIPYSFRAFHENLAGEADNALELPLWKEWVAANPDKVPLRPSDCVAYKVPVFLNGGQGVELLEVTDMDVYWTLTSQLLVSARQARKGTAITEIRTDDA